MNDLETRIRDALRADEIGWDDLRQPTLRVAPRSPRRWPALLAAAAAVAVVGSVAAVIAVTRHGTGSNGSAGARPAYAGYAWQMTALTDRRGPIADAASVHAQIEFSDSAVIGTLTGGSVFGRYQATSDGYDVTHVGLAGLQLDPARVSSSEKRIGHDLVKLFMHSQGGVFYPSRSATVVARVSDDHLELQASGITMQLSRVGPSRPSPMIDAIGYTWNVLTLTDKHGRLTLPSRLHATIEFDRYGLVIGNDTVNTAKARFGLTGDGYVVAHRVTTSAVGYAGQDPTLTRLIAAVNTMVSGDAAVIATIDSDTLTLHRNGIALTLHRSIRKPPTVDMYITGYATAGGAASSAVSSAPKSAPVSSVSVARGAPGSHH